MDTYSFKKQPIVLFYTLYLEVSTEEGKLNGIAELIKYIKGVPYSREPLAILPKI